MLGCTLGTVHPHRPRRQTAQLSAPQVQHFLFETCSATHNNRHRALLCYRLNLVRLSASFGYLSAAANKLIQLESRRCKYKVGKLLNSRDMHR